MCFGLLLGCGRSNDKQIKDALVYDLNQKAGCDLDPKKIGKILEENIHDQIDCLETSLNLFLGFVKLPVDDKIGKKDLSLFTERFFPEQHNETSRFLEIVLEINNVFLRNVTDGLPIVVRDNKRELHKDVAFIAKEVNTFGPPLYKLINEIFENEESYWEKKPLLISALKDFSNSYKRIIANKDFNFNKIDIIKFKNSA